MPTEQPDQPDQPTPLTPELITGVWAPSEVRLSPDGTRAAWVAAPSGTEGEHPESSIWLAPVDGSNPARRLTRGGADTSPRWSPDGTRLAFLSDRAERGTAGAWVIDPDGGEAVAVAVRATAVAALAWSPDSTTLALLAPDEPDDEAKRREEERDDVDVWGERWPWNRLLTVPADPLDPAPPAAGTARPPAAGADARLVWSGELFATELAWSPDGASIALLTRPTPELDTSWRSRVLLVPVAAPDQPAEGTDSGTDLGTAPWGEGLAWTVDGTAVLVTGKHSDTVQSSSTVWSLPSDASGPVVVGPARTEPVCALGHAPAPAGAPGSALVAIADGIDTRLEWRDASGAREVLEEPDGEVVGFDVAGDGTGGGTGRVVLAALLHAASGPLEVWAGAPGALRRLSDHHAAWAGVDFGEVRELRTTTQDGWELRSIAVLPPGAGGGPHPTVVLPHGGPYWRMARNVHCSWHDWSQLLAAAGYAVLLPNFRGSSGGGDAFATAVNGQPAVQHDDVLAVIATAVEEGITDPDRLGIGGWSNGGFLTAWAITATDRFSAAVMGAGVTQWPAMAMTSDVPTFEHQLAGGSPWSAEVGNSLAHSPLTHAARITTPLLVLHGERDERVPLSQAVGLHRALRERDLPLEMAVYPREPHSIGERRHQQDVLRRVLRWFTTHLPVAAGA